MFSSTATDCAAGIRDGYVGLAVAVEVSDYAGLIRHIDGVRNRIGEGASAATEQQLDAAELRPAVAGVTGVGDDGVQRSVTVDIREHHRCWGGPCSVRWRGSQRSTAAKEDVDGIGQRVDCVADDQVGVAVPV